MTGIAEINLPIDYKIKNIERTEMMKVQKAMAMKQAPLPNLPSNMGTNFQAHRRGMLTKLAAMFTCIAQYI